MSGQELHPPRQRECERCGRVDRWDDDAGHWRIAARDGGRLAGEPFCIHEWDITGNYNPFDPPDA